jgi:ABC-type lipoprotein export system ATPase subunit
VGPSGSGKSTLISISGGLLTQARVSLSSATRTSASTRRDSSHGFAANGWDSCSSP